MTFGCDLRRFLSMTLMGLFLVAPFPLTPLTRVDAAESSEGAVNPQSAKTGHVTTTESAEFSNLADQSAPSDKQIAYFETHVRPVLIQRCYSCHSMSSGKSEGGLLLDSTYGWLRGGERGAAVVPGDVAGSPLLRAVQYTDPDLQMPPTEKLGDDVITRLQAWIQMGAVAPANDHPQPFASPSDPVAGKDHWAFQRLHRPSVPEVKNPEWARNDIDRFVQARLESEQFTPVADAVPADQLRRLTFQLIGLPPTAAQVQAWVHSPTPAIWEQLVNELLDSPQFGQRWGRHWLDLARYADSNGLDENFLFREAWRYRNWVIDAVNSDMPFDRFLLEQLAGDLLQFDTIDQRDRQRIAAGFLVMGPKVLLGVNPQKQKMDVADEQIETVMRVAMAQTVGCARCHDHKFDPVPTADYYALAGIFTSTRVMEQRFMLNEQRVMERLVGLGDDGEQLNAAYEKYWRELPGLKSRLEKVRAALELLRGTDEAAIAQQIATQADTFADGAKDPAATQAARVAAQEALVKQLEDEVAHPPAIPPRAMIPSDLEMPADEAIRRSGKFDDMGDKVARGFLQVLTDGERCIVPESQSGRLELSQWLTDSQGRSGALTARVQANRIWQHLMGRGLVRTVDNFGRTGEQPSHPELLDHLASDLVDGKWSAKALIRKIVLSRTFVLSSDFDSINESRDPENRLLWRAHRRRLDPESLRDAILAAAGTLELAAIDSTVSYLGDQATAVGGNPVRRRTDFNCRSVYLPVIRNDLPELFDVFDFANPHMATGERPRTTVPTQGLFMLNDSLVIQASEACARRIVSDTAGLAVDARIRRMFELMVSGEVTDNEREAMQAFLHQTEMRLMASGDPEAQTNALALACQAVFASSRFQYLE